MQGCDGGVRGWPRWGRASGLMRRQGRWGLREGAWWFVFLEAIPYASAAMPCQVVGFGSGRGTAEHYPGSIQDHSLWIDISKFSIMRKGHNRALTNLYFLSTHKTLSQPKTYAPLRKFCEYIQYSLGSSIYPIKVASPQKTASHL